MSKTRFIQIASIVLVAVWSVPAIGQDVADNPDLRVGDEWIFHETGEDDGKPVDRRWRRRIAEKLPNDTIRVQPPDGGIDVFDTSWNPRNPQHPEFWPLNFKFPLRVGAAWSYASQPGAITRNGLNYDFRGHMRVVAYESITVPAGTFKCFRIEGGNEQIRANRDGNADYKNAETWRMTTWYCPDIRYMGKQHTERFIGGSTTKAAYRTLDHELIAYNPARVPVSVLFDGTWNLTLACDADAQSPVGNREFRIVVRGGEFVLRIGDAGEPGYSRITGHPTEDGWMILNGVGISKSAASAGQGYAIQLRGRLSGETGVFKGKYGVIPCDLTMTRVGS